MNNVIPPITDRLGVHYSQPDTKYITITDTHATMSIQTFNKLAEYSTSYPSGQYAGKIWKCACPGDHSEWLLCWFYDHENDPKLICIGYRTIILQEVVDLIMQIS